MNQCEKYAHEIGKTYFPGVSIGEAEKAVICNIYSTCPGLAAHLKLRKIAEIMKTLSL